MKKFLSLVLALVMTMSLVTVSAGAKDFTDGSKINYKEAVDVMSAVKVIDGYAEGDFRPSATLTRGAAAKIICNLILWRPPPRPPWWLTPLLTRMFLPTTPSLATSLTARRRASSPVTPTVPSVPPLP